MLFEDLIEENNISNADFNEVQRKRLAKNSVSDTKRESNQTFELKWCELHFNCTELNGKLIKDFTWLLKTRPIMQSKSW